MFLRRDRTAVTTGKDQMRSKLADMDDETVIGHILDGFAKVEMPPNCTDKDRREVAAVLLKNLRAADSTDSKSRPHDGR